MNFKHGGDVADFAYKHGYSVDEVIDLSSNINPLKPKLDIDFSSLDISNYPNYSKLKGAIAKNYSVESEQLELFNGLSSGILSLFRTLKLRRVTLYAPIYLEYKRSAILNGYSLEYIDRFKNLDMAVEQNSLVVFVNPSTPDGKFYDIAKFWDRWVESEATILIDESFLEFTNFSSALNYLGSYEKLYILKSMTKFYSCAGVRVGAIISNPQNIAKLSQNEPVWKISEFDSQYIQSALRDREFPTLSKELNIKNRTRVRKILEQNRYVERVYPSETNFLLLKLKGINAKGFQSLLTPYKIMVRECSNFDFLDSSYVRIAIKGESSIARLKEALCESSI